MGSEIILRNLLIGFLVMTMFMAGAAVFSSQLYDSYDITMDDNFTVLMGNFTTQLDQTTNIVDEMQNTTEKSTGIEVLDDAIGISSQMWGVIKQPFSLLKVFMSMVTQASSYLSVPVWFLNGILSIAIILLTLTIISVLFRTDV